MIRMRNEQGFALPTVLAMIIVLSLVAYGALLQANNGLNLSYKQSYLQMARIASKSAVDYSQEQFDSALCGNYNGTAEQNIVQNSRYRVTLKSEVVSTSADGYEKIIKGTGAVYLPKDSATARYVFDVRSEILRTYATCKTPDNLGPLLWYDASDTTKLLKLNTGSTSASQAGLGLLDLITPNDTIEEKVSDGTQGLSSWLSDDIEMSTCDALEFVLACSGTTAQRALYNGFVFSTSIPKGSTINSATLQVSGATPSGSGGSVTNRIYGLYNTGSDPHLPLFSPTGSNQVKSRITNSSLRTAAFDDVTTNNIPPGNPVNFDVTNVVQEMVNNANWSNGTLGFGVQRQSGNGTRKLCKGNFISSNACNGKGPKLTITYSAAAPSPSNNGDSLFEWDPVTGWGVPAKFAYGTQPTRVDNQINGKSVVRFNNGTLLSSLTSALSDKREMTVMAVVKPTFSTSSSDGRLITGMSSTGTNDTSGSNGIIPLYRNGSNSGFSSNYSGNSSTNRTDFTCGVSCDSRAYVLASAFGINGTNNKILATLKGEGSTQATKNDIAPAAAPGPYTWTIDQFYIGGRRNGTMAAGTGTNYLNGDYAEIVVYDKILTCRQIESLEDYFRIKWALSASPYASTCPADLVPVL